MSVEEEVENFISKKFKYDINNIKNMSLTKKISLIESDKKLHFKMKLHLRNLGYII